MKKFVFVAAVLFAIHSTAVAAEELAPGFDACVDRATSTADNNECFGAAFEYWDKILNASFRALPKACSDAPDPDACRAKVVKAQKLWIQYKEAMAEAIADMAGGGSAAGLAANNFIVEETKKQAKLLGPADE